MLWRALAGGLIVFGAGSATAAPPGLQPGRHAEGRELDPVARDHFLPNASVAPAVPTASETPATGATGCGPLWALAVGTHAAVLDAFTMPLGTARAEEM